MQNKLHIIINIEGNTWRVRHVIQFNLCDKDVKKKKNNKKPQ